VWSARASGATAPIIGRRTALCTASDPEDV
jgi:hypothetical protein